MGILSAYIFYKAGKRKQRRESDCEELIEESRAARPQQSSTMQDSVAEVVAERKRRRDEDPTRVAVNEFLNNRKK